MFSATDFFMIVFIFIFQSLDFLLDLRPFRTPLWQRVSQLHQRQHLFIIRLRILRDDQFSIRANRRCSKIVSIDMILDPIDFNGGECTIVVQDALFEERRPNHTESF